LEPSGGANVRNLFWTEQRSSTGSYFGLGDGLERVKALMRNLGHPKTGHNLRGRQESLRWRRWRLRSRKLRSRLPLSMFILTSRRFVRCCFACGICGQGGRWVS